MIASSPLKTIIQMKKIFIYLLIGVFSFTACKKENNTILADPDERLIEILKNYKQTLTEASNGWIASLYPSGGGGYSFYIDFDEKDRVIMLSDFNSESATETFESTYRLKALQRPTLIFDTYNYIHLLADPDESLNGGEKGLGLKSDFEFAFLKLVQDSIYFEGTFNKNKMELRAASAEEKEAILSGAWNKMMVNTTSFLNQSKHSYLTLGDERKLALDINPQKKNLLLSWLTDDGKAMSASANYRYTQDGIVFDKALIYDGKSFDSMFWNEENSEYYVKINNENFSLKTSQTPIMPMYTLFGFGKDWTQLEIIGETLPPGISSSFNSVFADYINRFRTSSTTGRKVLYTRLDFGSIDQAVLTVRYVALDASGNNTGSEFSATITYDYTLVNDIVTLKEASLNGNWNTRANQLLPLREYFANRSFRVDWVNNPDLTSTNYIGGLYLTSDAGYFFYGMLNK